MLTEEAEHWWDNVCQRLDNAEIAITCAVYKNMFLVKYFPEDIRNRKEMEFIKLEQGNMSVVEYVAKFEELSRYYPLYVGELEKEIIVVMEKEMETVIFMGVVEEAPMGEELITGIVTTRVKSQATTMVIMAIQLLLSDVTSVGHISTTCPYPRKTPQPGNQSSQASRPKSNGRVFALSGVGASEKDNLIQGTCLISDTSLFVLFDCGATHSFVSFDCVRRLGLPVSRLQYDLIMNTPTSNFVDTCSVCLDISIYVCGRDFRVDLMCLPLRLVDVILDMDWLSANRVCIDFFSKTIEFMEPEEMENPRNISANQVKALLK
ncbi:uncharacterized protein [Cicer arietinum]|uniref:Uncharacterized protein LOC101488566 n=1 Tax=Cicer arietinum TaxID=3827 RepID=A0A1S2XFL5_CICAR|nr:uncharacterized protein LOC101488566 [Cicer arietinum]